MGDVKSLGGGLHELRIVFGPGYRIYFTFEADVLILLLIGGDKASQSRDISVARKMIEDGCYGQGENSNRTLRPG